jgi:hypothetical protein
MDDAEPTKAADVADSENEQTTAIADSSETAPAELAGSAATEEQETETISETRSRALWLGPMMALLAAAIAVASVSAVLRTPRTSTESTGSRAAVDQRAPGAAIADPATRTHQTRPNTTTTTTAAVASGPAIGEPCSDWSKIARESQHWTDVHLRWRDWRRRGASSLDHR